MLRPTMLRYVGMTFRDRFSKVLHSIIAITAALHKAIKQKNNNYNSEVLS